jgi:hypothetical protein
MKKKTVYEVFELTFNKTNSLKTGMASPSKSDLAFVSSGSASMI